MKIIKFKNQFLNLIKYIFNFCFNMEQKLNLNEIENDKLMK